MPCDPRRSQGLSDVNIAGVFLLAPASFSWAGTPRFSGSSRRLHRRTRIGGDVFGEGLFAQ